jgi:hypothetical protein
VHAPADQRLRGRQKERVAVEDGDRESTESGLTVLRALHGRGFEAPRLAIGEVALGFGKALSEVWLQTPEQRGWVHRTANVLDKLPKRIEPRAQKHLHEIFQAETPQAAEEEVQSFVKEYSDRYTKGRRHAGERRREAADLLRLPGGALADDPQHERGRVGLCHGEAAAARPAGSGNKNSRPEDGASTARDGREALQSDPESTSRSEAAGRKGVPGRKSRRGGRKGRVRCLIRLDLQGSAISQ